MQRTEKTKLITKIIRFNHAWKLALQQFGKNSNLAKSLRDQKACLQAELLRDHAGTYLTLDKNTESEELLYSVKFDSNISLPGLPYKDDAEHLPVRIAQKLFSENELLILVRE
jgi:hypothetical protein